jgi:hypothetical protein
MIDFYSYFFLESPFTRQTNPCQSNPIHLGWIDAIILLSYLSDRLYYITLKKKQFSANDEVTFA